MSPRGLIKCPLKLKPRAKGVLLKRTATSTRDLERVQVMDTWIPDIRRLLVSSATISNSELPKQPRGYYNSNNMWGGGCGRTQGPQIRELARSCPAERGHQSSAHPGR